MVAARFHFNLFCIKSRMDGSHERMDTAGGSEGRSANIALLDLVNIGIKGGGRTRALTVQIC